MNILVINAGSSSLKYQLINMTGESILAKGIVERIGNEGSNLCHKYSGKRYDVVTPLKNHVEAIQLVLTALTDPEHGVISNMDEIGAVGHRVVHGGEKFASSTVIDDEVVAAIEENCALAPLHNPANLMGISACREVMPNTPMVAVFDTAFHQTMPPRAYLYGLPYEYYTRLKVRRYGFHGTSHKYVAARTAEILGRPLNELKLIICHLGNGSSLSAVDGGKSIDTTMGMTPLEGVVMGTRSGNIDPAIIEYVMKQQNMTIDEVMSVLNKQSGLLGLSGNSSDMRDIWKGADAGDQRCKVALDVLSYGIRKYIGAYAAAMGGLDALIFTAGIGENDGPARELATNGLEFLGISINKELNWPLRETEMDISAPGARVKTLVVPTNEELSIARDTLMLTKK